MESITNSEFKDTRPLLEQISSFENVERALKSCAAGKRNQLASQLALNNHDRFIFDLCDHLSKGQDYPWGPYREFYVTDPKRRLVASAPFRDRVAHRAIYNILEPILDQHLLPCTFACRHRMGNGRAVVRLAKIIRGQDQYFAMKLDVSKFFFSINHRRLMAKITKILPEKSIIGLLRGLMLSHPDYAHGTGIPLGNLTSQIFANFYLYELDQYIYTTLRGSYVRYMDDMVLICKNRNEAREILSEVIKRVKQEKLKVPKEKRWRLGQSSIPFLGFLVGVNTIKPLNRNYRRIRMKLRKKAKCHLRPSQVAQSVLSYEKWIHFVHTYKEG